MPWFRGSTMIAAALAMFVIAGGWYVGAKLRDGVDSDLSRASSADSVNANSENKGRAMSTDGAQQNTSFTPKTDEEWRKLLTEEQFYVTRKKGTERAFSGEYWDTKTPGVYKCVCCGEPLFTSEAKFDSHCGWPSFYQPIDGLKDKRIEEHVDKSHFMVRTEVTCKKCGAHLGHIFDDSPQTPTGMRYCINSASLRLEEKKDGGAAKPEPAKPSDAK